MLGIFNCQIHGQLLCDTNHPPRKDCGFWEEKHDQKPLTLKGAFVGITNDPAQREKLTEGEYRYLRSRGPDRPDPRDKILEEELKARRSRCPIVFEDVS
jgi:hypothetical protein